MARKHPPARWTIALLAGACAGCSSAPHPEPESVITVLEPLAPLGPVLTLGAGDALGRSVFVQDVILAALARAAEPVIVDAPVELEDDQAR
ncbi:MAG TPA: hypothetical protein DEB06_07180 [Phycisphaerales bacterium]|nr:hypothetical protein [Phycisphaerales bacterium]